MNNKHIETVAAELKLQVKQVAATVALLEEDATVPFIARYRKEATGSLDEVAITAIRDRIGQLGELDKRREAILKSLTERELLTNELKSTIDAADTMALLEDLYLPYRPKRRTRATMARERGLEPLAELLLSQEDDNPEKTAGQYVDAEKDVDSVETALAGARDIIAEWINEDADARRVIRKLFHDQGMLRSTVVRGKSEEGSKFSDYFDWEEPIKKVPSHRLLAIRRGEAEGMLTVHLAPDTEMAIGALEHIFVIADNRSSEQVRQAVEDGYKRLLAPAIETEIRNEMIEKADEEAIHVFAQNVRELLMSPPLGRKRVLALDPGFRTGCKVVCLDRQGSLLDNTTIYPHKSDAEREDASVTLKALCEKHRINVIAVGNGTAGRETEQFVRSLGLPEHIVIEMVDESGASIYSASEVARNEFPDRDVTVRGAVSIGRRLMDPLAELVKIDPKSIGVGQYQHDVNQGRLKQSLDDTVVSCVNAVGVEVNTASRELLAYVSGLGPGLAANVVTYRNEQGAIKSRKELSKVPRLGPKAFEQAAGFLRIADAANPLDRSAVHPESYAVVENMAADLGTTVGRIMEDPEIRQRIELKRYVGEKTGMPTLQDIMNELAKPGRDPRAEFEAFQYDDSVQSIEDLKAGMKLPGIVTNVTKFGAFVDIGVHQDGLVHVSELADRFVRDPLEEVKVRQKVTVTVVSIDLERNRIALSMRERRPD